MRKILINKTFNPHRALGIGPRDNGGSINLLSPIHIIMPMAGEGSR